jgi:Cd2+/Zn2+-exporting ATPase/Cu+-exporting ATPase
LAALLVSQWAAAAVIVFFMRVGGMLRRFHSGTCPTRREDLAMAPPANRRVERAGQNGNSTNQPETRDWRYSPPFRPGEKKNSTVDLAIVLRMRRLHRFNARPLQVSRYLSKRKESSPYPQPAAISSTGLLQVRALKVSADTTFRTSH